MPGPPRILLPLIISMETEQFICLPFLDIVSRLTIKQRISLVVLVCGTKIMSTCFDNVACDIRYYGLKKLQVNIT